MAVARTALEDLNVRLKDISALKSSAFFEFSGALEETQFTADS